jgi:fatty acid desaturase
MHEGGHYSLTGKIAIDRTLQIVIYGVGCGMSGSWWRNQHNKHHAMPQRVGMYMFIYMHIYVCIYMYIYIYICINKST